jgi:hypothetical protein
VAAGVKRYLSYGGGVNSTALLLWLIDHGIETEAVYADLGTDWPETQEYVALLANKYPITILKTTHSGMTIEGKIDRWGVLPSRQLRWCTQNYKVEPLRAYFQKPCIVYVGISAEESQRAKPAGVDGMDYQYPLVEEGIDRDGCLQIIRDHGLPEPIKSGCFFCPFQRRSQWQRLLTLHPDLFCKVKEMEYKAMQRRIAQGKKPFYLMGDKPIGDWAMEGQPDLFGEREITPCLCGL